jgi:hypothetical protein
MPDFQPGDPVVLISIPATLMSDLPEEDQVAIRSVVGRTVTFAGFSYGQAEVEFKDKEGDDHTIWVDADRISGPEIFLSRCL